MIIMSTTIIKKATITTGSTMGNGNVSESSPPSSLSKYTVTQNKIDNN